MRSPISGELQSRLETRGRESRSGWPCEHGARAWGNG